LPEGAPLAIHQILNRMNKVNLTAVGSFDLNQPSENPYGAKTYVNIFVRAALNQLISFQLTKVYLKAAESI